MNRKRIAHIGLAVVAAAVMVGLGTGKSVEASVPIGEVPGDEALQVSVPMAWSTVMVRLAEQADVSAAYGVHGKEARTQFVFDALNEVANRTQPELVAWLEARGARVERLWIVNALVVDADPVTVNALELRPDVAQVRPLQQISLIEPVTTDEPHRGGSLMSLASPQLVEASLKTIRADRVWKMGYEGQGVVVAITDTGAAYRHPALKNKYRGEDDGHDYNWFDAIDGEEEPLDRHGHGTHVTGTSVGSTSRYEIGVAPEAKWISCRLIEQRSGTDAQSIKCLQWVLAPTKVDGTEPRPDKAPDVVNASWGGEPGKDCEGSAALHRAVSNLEAAGILFVTSAGNKGSGCSTICAPGLFKEAWTVANATRTGAINNSSSRGPVEAPGAGEIIKPDITAPGTDINSSIPTTRYKKMSGTSMASPHVAGAVALLISAREELRGRPELIRPLFENTADFIRADKCGPRGDELQNNQAGYGMIDVEKAVEIALTATPPPSRTPTRPPTATRTPRPTNTGTLEPSATLTRRPSRTPTAPGWGGATRTPSITYDYSIYMPRTEN